MRGYINRYYACANKYHEHKCQAKPINADEIEKAIIDYLKEDITINHKDEIISTMIKNWSESSKDCTKEKKELAKINKELINMMNALKKGIIFDELETEISKYQLRQAELKEIIKQNSDNNPKISNKDLEILFEN